MNSPEGFWSLIATQGPWAVLFVLLLFYVMRESGKRESKLMDFVEKVGTRIEAICADIASIRSDIHELKKDQEEK